MALAFGDGKLGASAGHYQTTKHQNNEAGIFFQFFFFFNTATHKEIDSADIGSVEKFVESAKRVYKRECLDVQSIP